MSRYKDNLSNMIWQRFEFQIGTHENNFSIEREHGKVTIDTDNYSIKGDGFKRRLIRRSEVETVSRSISRIRKKVSAVVQLRDAIQVFHQDTNPKNFRYINSSNPLDHSKYDAISETISWQPRRCALVGNSGILNKSKCGSSIDAHDFVIRMNLAPIGGIYADDVGSKVSIMTMNWEQLLLAVRCTRNRTNDVTKECDELDGRMNQARDGIVWYTKGGYADRLGIVAEHMLKNHHGNGKRGPRWAYSPRVMQGICKTLWKNKNPSTGLIAFSLASLICDEISLFGFYPFEKDTLNRTISYHYYEPHSSKLFFYNKHRMPVEFRIFKTFGKHGSPGSQLVIQPCA
ncbi:CMP-N-acetylneuraminate-poly-alpha-2,8-sialyltransferase-like [Lytechinus pictus]|uniref:CMP-N-acetylneuraminate-poly-alpha-2, 8-sialyltransferase-like n=1 Tax=Lytechinus pictus TaxID=7653 RepID=UPI0030BA15CA